jgi:hypothetical protein
MINFMKLIKLVRTNVHVIWGHPNFENEAMRWASAATWHSNVALNHFIYASHRCFAVWNEIVDWCFFHDHLTQRTGDLFAECFKEDWFPTSASAAEGAFSKSYPDLVRAAGNYMMLYASVACGDWGCWSSHVLGVDLRARVSSNPLP